MKNFISKAIIVFLCSGLIPLLDSCEKKHALVVLTTTAISDITQTSAVGKGNIIDEEAIVIEKGICLSADEDSELKNYQSHDENDTGSFVTVLKGLKPATNYYAKSYAITLIDTIYGNAISFKTLNFETIKDSDGNVYKTVTIGTQTWMASNLKSTKYNDDSSIPLIVDDKMWAASTMPGYCWYKNDEDAFKDQYGALYNWYAINTTKLCPQGWHVPNEADWELLISYLGGENIAGGSLKGTGTDYWVEPNTGATNLVGFSALPGGFRHSEGKFYDFGFSGYWWSSKQYIPTRAYFRFNYYNQSDIFRFNNLKNNGFSVRCLKD